MNKKKIMISIFTFILIFAMAIPTQAAVKISKKSITLTAGKKKQLKITGTKKKVKWSSSKKSVATVSSKGVVTAKRKGTATITAKVGKKKYKCKVTVKAKKKTTTTTDTDNEPFSDSGEIITPTVTPTPTPTQAIKEYSIGETWTVAGEYSYTINKVWTTTERNQFSDINPAQVIMIEYTCKNIGYNPTWTDTKTLWPMVYSAVIIDEVGYTGGSYPGNITYYPQQLYTGTSCTAEECFYVTHTSSYIKLTMETYDSNFKTHTATFKLKVS